MMKSRGKGETHAEENVDDDDGEDDGGGGGDVDVGGGDDSVDGSVDGVCNCDDCNDDDDCE